MKSKRIKCPCGCESELLIGIPEEGDYIEDTENIFFGNLLLSIGKQKQKNHRHAVVITKDILKLLNNIMESRIKSKKKGLERMNPNEFPS